MDNNITIQDRQLHIYDVDDFNIRFIRSYFRYKDYKKRGYTHIRLKYKIVEFNEDVVERKTLVNGIYELKHVLSVFKTHLNKDGSFKKPLTYPLFLLLLPTPNN